MPVKKTPKKLPKKASTAPLSGGAKKVPRSRSTAAKISVSLKKEKQSLVAKKKRKEIQAAVAMIPNLIVQEAASTQSKKTTEQIFSSLPTPMPRDAYQIAGHIQSPEDRAHLQQKKRFVVAGVTVMSLLICALWILNAKGLIANVQAQDSTLEKELYSLAKDDFTGTLSALDVLEKQQNTIAAADATEEEQTIAQIKNALSEQLKTIATTLETGVPTTTTSSTPATTDIPVEQTPTTQQES
jgi:hypothetical protein